MIQPLVLVMVLATHSTPARLMPEFQAEVQRLQAGTGTRGLIPRTFHLVNPTPEVQAAATIWNEMLGEPVFEPQGTPIQVELTQNLEQDHHQIAGLVTWVPGGTTLQLRQGLTPAQLKNSALHELGHVLGLDDCTDGRQGSVMGLLNLRHPLAKPATWEVQTVKALRSAADAADNLSFTAAFPSSTQSR